jgi:hypothetical protein
MNLWTYRCDNGYIYDEFKVSGIHMPPYYNDEDANVTV